MEVHTINLAQLFTGWMVVLIPMLYQVYFINHNYIYMFVVAQAFYVISDGLCIFLSTRFNLKLGIPDILLFYLSGNIAMIFDKGLFFFATSLLLAKLIPVGIEATMLSLSMTIFVMNMTIFRPLGGILINKYFFNVERENLATEYIKIKIVSLIGSLSPYLYMYCLIPTNQQAEAVYIRNNNSSTVKDKDTEVAEEIDENETPNGDNVNQPAATNKTGNTVE